MGTSIERASGGPGADPAEHRVVDASRTSNAPGFLRRRLPAILIPLLLVPGAALGFSLLKDKQYEASTSLLFRDTGDVFASAEPGREAATNVRLLQLGELRDRVRERLGTPLTADVDVVAEAESNLATIIVTDTDPKTSAHVANAYAKEYIDFRQEANREEIAAETEAVNAALAELESGQPNDIEREALLSRLRELGLAAAAPPEGAVQFGRAEPPLEASSPKPLQNTVIGALLGLALGVAAAIALERHDRRVRDPHSIESALGRPIIGRIPHSRALATVGRRKGGRGTAALPPEEAEAFRTVRANLRRQNVRSVLVTSALPREGKSTVVWNLARVEAVSGARVLLVEADLRRPVLAHNLGANGTAGLSELLAGEAQLQDLVQSVDFDDSTALNGDSPPGAIDVLFAGRPPANPAELLDSERMKAVLEAVSESYDLVVVDTPPALVSDAMPILDLVGGVVVVGRPGLSTDESLRELRERLERVGASMLGVVVNGDTTRARHYDYYQAPGKG